MKLAEFITEVREKYLKNRSDALEFAAAVFNIEYQKIPLHLSDEADITEDINHKLQRLADGEPLAYVINNKTFYGLDFYVDSRVLIPRPETEILAETALSYMKSMTSPVVLDICTGSGCIPSVLLSERPDAYADVLDISGKALEVSDINLKKYASGRYGLIKADAFSCTFSKTYDIVTCNPPYLSENEWVKSDKSLKYEPKNALSAGDDPLLFYKKLIDMIPYLCNKNGVALFELGIGQAEAVRHLFSGTKFHFVKDYQNIERVLVWINL